MADLEDDFEQLLFSNVAQASQACSHPMNCVFGQKFSRGLERYNSRSKLTCHNLNIIEASMLAPPVEQLPIRLSKQSCHAQRPWRNNDSAGMDSNGMLEEGSNVMHLRHQTCW